MNVLLLAAGIGTRMKEMGKTIPKCLLKVGEKTLLEEKKEQLLACGVPLDNIFVVVGKQGECWNEEYRNAIKEIIPNMIVNEKNVDLNQVFSFYTSISTLPAEDTLVLDGDLIIQDELMKELLAPKDHTTLLTQTPQGENPAGNKVVLNNGCFAEKITREHVEKQFTIYAGAFYLAKKDIQLFKEIAAQEELQKKDLGLVFDNACAKTKLAILQNDTQWRNINSQEDLEEVRSLR